MALSPLSLSLYASVPIAGRTEPLNFYKYGTPDAPATVIAAGYFNALRTKPLRVGDVIDAVCSVNGTPDRISMLITAVPASADITVAINTDASGA